MENLPKGSDEIIEVLSKLDPKYDNTIYNRKVKQFAQNGLIFCVGEYYGIECKCPFYKAKGKDSYLLRPGSYYSHRKTCVECQVFTDIVHKLNNTLLEKVAELCSISNISLNELYSKKFNELLRFANPFFRTINRNDIRNKIFELFKNLRNDLKTKCSDEFCSILVDGETRNNINFYGYIIHTKSRLFYFTIKSVDNATAVNISNLTLDIIDYFKRETNLEIVAICSDHAQNLVKAFNPSDQISCQAVSNYYFEWIGCFAHLINLGIGDLFQTDEFCIIYMSLNSILHICKEINLDQKIPSFSKTRWDSYSKCLNFLNSKKQTILKYLDAEIEKLNNAARNNEQNQENIENYNYYKEILNSDIFNELTQLFVYISEMSSKIGSDTF